MLVARGRDVPLVWDVDADAAPVGRGPSSASASQRAQQEALACDVVVTVTPGREILLSPRARCEPGQHVS